jgi:hypothetical protein
MKVQWNTLGPDYVLRSLGSKGWTIVRTRTPEDMQHSGRTGYRADCWGMQDRAEGYARVIEHLSGHYDTLRRC